MIVTNVVSGRVRVKRAWMLGLVSVSAWSTAAMAQDGTAAAASGDAVQLERIEVLGSRIRKSESENAAPVRSLSREDLDASGLGTVGEVLAQLSVSGSSLNTKFNSAGNFGFPPDGGGVGSGSSTVALRHLTAKRTLVLVDGLRWVNESSASGVSAAVDINTIPLSIVERIDVLTDGASAIYGSDAIGGVVNIITKSRQDGISVSAYGSDYATGDGTSRSANISIGGSADRFDYIVDLSYFKQNAISSDEWEQSRYPVPGTGVALGSSAIPNTRTVYFPDGNNTYNGLCPLDGGVATCDVVANGTVVGGPQSFPGGFHAFSTDDRFNFAPYNLLLTPSERKAVFAQTRYKLGDRVAFSIKGLYQNRESVNQAAPEPIFIGPGAGTGGLADTVGVDVSNPYNPFGVTLDPNSNLVFAARRPLEGGPRVFSQNVDTFYVTMALAGDFDLAERVYNWDVHYIDSSNRAQQTVTGTYNIAHIQRALGPVSNCDGTIATGGCVPLNFFGGVGSITPEMLNYIAFTENDRSEQKLRSFTANLTGPIVTLPAGDLSFAAGLETRRLSGSYSPDAVVTAGETNGVPSLPTSGDYSVDEAYLELSVPLLADRPLAYALELDLATRYSDYDTFGDTTNSKIGLRYQPVRELTLRGTWAEGFRAPSVGELYASASRFDATLEDPCSNATDAAIVANCAALGTPANFEQANTQISVSTGGNEELEPETSKSWTAGLVWSPAWAEQLAWSRRLDFEVTYYKIKLDNAIQSLDAQTQLDRCVATLDDAFCSGISRGSSGDINGFDNTLLNVGTIDVSGVDFGITWVGPVTTAGRFGLDLNATFVDEYRAVSKATGLEEPRKVGVEVADSGIPEWRGTARLNWALSALSASWTMRYIDALTEQCGDAVDFGVCDNPEVGTNKLGSTVYNDARVQWKLPGKVDATVAAGVNNVFDKDPPVCVSCSLNGYDASLYDLPGQYGYLQATVHY